MDRYRIDIQGYTRYYRYGEIQVKYRLETPKIHARGGLLV